MTFINPDDQISFTSNKEGILMKYQLQKFQIIPDDYVNFLIHKSRRLNGARLRLSENKF